MEKEKRTYKTPTTKQKISKTIGDIDAKLQRIETMAALDAMHKQYRKYLAKEAGFTR